MKSRVTITLDPDVHRPQAEGYCFRTDRIFAPVRNGSAKRWNRGGMVGTASLRSPSPGTDPLYDVLQAKYVR